MQMEYYGRQGPDQNTECMLINSQCADPEPPENSQNIGVLSNSGPDLLKNYEATEPAFNVGLSPSRHFNGVSHDGR